MIEIVESYRSDGDRDIPFWEFWVDDRTNDNFCIQEQIIALMYGWA